MQRRTQRTLTPTAEVAATEDSDSPPHSSPLLPKLPDDIALQCIARVPFFYHRDLSLVSKSWRSVFRSPCFFSTRKRLNRTQHLLCIPLFTRTGSLIKLLAFDIDPCNPKNPSNLSVVSFTPFEADGPVYPAIAVLGPRIYVLGGSVNNIPSTTVWILDCRSKRWEIGPKMGVGRKKAAAAVLHGNFFVFGGCFTNSNNWAEVLDPALGYWVTVPSPIEFRMELVCASAVVNEKFYVRNETDMVVFDPCDSSWRKVPIDFRMLWKSAAVVDGILYCPSTGDIMGLDVEEVKWQELKWVNKDWPTHWFQTKAVNVGGRLCVLWVDLSVPGREYRICCDEVEVRKDSNGELWGSIVSSQPLMEVPHYPVLDHCCTIEL